MRVLDYRRAEVQTTDATLTTLMEYTIPSGKSGSWHAFAWGRNTTTDDIAAEHYRGIFVNNGGTAAEDFNEDDMDIGSPTAGAFGVTVSSNKVIIEVTGEVSTTYNWRGVILVENLEDA